MSNSTKGINRATNFMTTCHLDHLREHVVSISWDIMVPPLGILVVVDFHH